jgi:hypothetical protein
MGPATRKGSYQPGSMISAHLAEIERPRDCYGIGSYELLMRRRAGDKPLVGRAVDRYAGLGDFSRLLPFSAS